MNKEKIIALLNKDLEDEHGAIIQYLSHAYAMGEGEVAEAYDRAAKEAGDPDVKRLLLRLRDHEIYHAQVFSDLLEQEPKEKGEEAE